jgi:hypothetical protein
MFDTADVIEWWLRIDDNKSNSLTFDEFINFCRIPVTCITLIVLRNRTFVSPKYIPRHYLRSLPFKFSDSIRLFLKQRLFVITL